MPSLNAADFDFKFYMPVVTTQSCDETVEENIEFLTQRTFDIPRMIAYFNSARDGSQLLSIRLDGDVLYAIGDD